MVKTSNNGDKISAPGKIFTPDYTTKPSGNGIGLSICKKFIESMYGKLTLEHSGEDYTEFAIRIGKLGGKS